MAEQTFEEFCAATPTEEVTLGMRIIAACEGMQDSLLVKTIPMRELQQFALALLSTGVDVDRGGEQK